MVLVICFSVVGEPSTSPTARRMSWDGFSAPPSSRRSPRSRASTHPTRVTRAGSLPFGEGASWLAEWIWAPGLILMFLPLLFLDGRPPSRRWRPVAWHGGLSIGLISVSASLVVWLLEGT